MEADWSPMFKRRKSNEKTKTTSEENVSDFQNVTDFQNKAWCGMNLLSANSCDTLSSNCPSPVFHLKSNLLTNSTRSSTGTVNIYNKTVSHASSMSTLSHSAASLILESREREKREMQKLNDQLAKYVEKVRFLEAQNRKLANDVEVFRRFHDQGASFVRSIYETELKEGRKLINESSTVKNELEKEFARLQYDLAEYRKKFEETRSKREIDKECIDNLLLKLCECESLANFLRRRIEIFEKEVNRIKKENFQLQNDLQNVRNATNHETLASIENQNQAQVLQEEIDFIKSVHEQEEKELESMVVLDTTEENREYFKHELTMAIRDIRSEHEAVYAQTKTDIDTRYQLKVKEIQVASARRTFESGYKKNESKRLRIQLAEFRGKLVDLETRNSLLEKHVQDLIYQLEDDQKQNEMTLNDRDEEIHKMRNEQKFLMEELQMLLDKKQTLDAEIAVYRKMLDGEVNRQVFLNC